MIARAVPVPRDALLQAYAKRKNGYTDCFEVMHPLEASLEDFVGAFYRSWLFRMERVGLSLALRRRIRDAEIDALVGGESDSFAVWKVEARETDQLLMAEAYGQTRSYFAVSSKEGGVTRLLFGSAVVVAGEGEKLPRGVTALTPVHRLYSKLLLRAAEKRLRRG